MKEKLLQLEILKRDKQIQELYVLIDTLQTNLRASTSQLDESTKEKHLFVTHNYGFPFAYGIGLNYMQMDKYFISTDISSSFVFSGVSVGGGKHLFDKFYAAMSVNGIYHGYTNNDKHKLDVGINPKLTYVLDKKNKRILINAGFIYTLEEIKNKNIRATFSLTYLIK